MRAESLTELNVPSRASHIALAGLFLLLGVIYATWSTRLPALRDALGLDAATLGTVLLGAGIGSVCSFPFTAFMLAHFGARRSAYCTGGLILVSLLGMPMWPSWPLLMAGLFVLGMASSCFDVAINAIAAQFEGQTAKPIMSSLHAWFCGGTLLGALLGSGAARLGLAPLAHFAVVALLVALALHWAVQALPCDKPSRQSDRQHLALPTGPLLWLGMVALLGAVSEGSLANWVAIYMRDHLHASEAQAPLAYAALAGGMLLSRALGDRLKTRFGGRRLVSLSSILAAAGMALAIVATSATVATFGFALAGIGVAAVFPCLFSAAGRQGPQALAGVATLGYSGVLLGPPLMGYIVHGFGLQAGIGALALTSLLLALIAWRGRLLDAS